MFSCSVLMVVGAGRGPLVRASIAASQQADRKIKKVYAVEKNPNAVVTLVPYWCLFLRGINDALYHSITLQKILVTINRWFFNSIQLQISSDLIKCL